MYFIKSADARSVSGADSCVQFFFCQKLKTRREKQVKIEYGDGKTKMKEVLCAIEKKLIKAQ